MSEVITFYSYKGGVGRSMALANVSIMLAKWGHKVLVVDWDLEAPGLEHFYKSFFDVGLVDSKPGIIDLLQNDSSLNWKDCVFQVHPKPGETPIYFISSGKRDAEYFKKVRAFNVDQYYENDGGDYIEKLRSEWLAEYDYVLIDSRTGITEIGGICTIQLPDTVAVLFTATDHGFDGVLDIIRRAAAAQQKLPYDRQKLVFLPIPSKFDGNTEFKLSQEWLEKFAAELEFVYHDWLPASVNRKEFLELTKIPYIPYFSFGEKLPVLEQGVKDPSGLGYAYESLAALVANHLGNVEMLNTNRDAYIDDVNKFYVPGQEVVRVGNDISKRLKSIRQKLKISEEPIILYKSSKSILGCLEMNIIPLVDKIMQRQRYIGSLFKRTYDTILVNYLKYDLSNRYEHQLNVFSRRTFFERIEDGYKNIRGYDLKNIVIKNEFIDLRAGTESKTRFSFEIQVEFNENNYEIVLKETTLNLDRLYHENLSGHEMDAISDAADNLILEKVDSQIH